mgnify:CR=1 FL=1
MAKKLTNDILNRLINETIEEVQSYVPSVSAGGRRLPQTGVGLPLARNAYKPKEKSSAPSSEEDTAIQFLKVLFQRKDVPQVFKKQIDILLNISGEYPKTKPQAAPQKPQITTLTAKELGAGEPVTSTTAKIPLSGRPTVDLATLPTAPTVKLPQTSWYKKLGSRIKNIFTENNGNIPKDILEKLILEIIEEQGGVSGFSAGGAGVETTQTPSEKSQFQAYKMGKDTDRLTPVGLLKMFYADPAFPTKIKSEVEEILDYIKSVTPTVKLPVEIPADLPEPPKQPSRTPTVKGTEYVPPTTKKPLAMGPRKDIFAPYSGPEIGRARV